MPESPAGDRLDFDDTTFLLGSLSFSNLPPPTDHAPQPPSQALLPGSLSGDDVPLPAKPLLRSGRLATVDATARTSCPPAPFGIWPRGTQAGNERAEGDGEVGGSPLFPPCWVGHGCLRALAMVPSLGSLSNRKMTSPGSTDPGASTNLSWPTLL